MSRLKSLFYFFAFLTFVFVFLWSRCQKNFKNVTYNSTLTFCVLQKKHMSMYCVLVFNFLGTVQYCRWYVIHHKIWIWNTVHIVPKWFLDTILKSLVNKRYFVNKQVKLFQNPQFCIKNQKVAILWMRVMYQNHL